MGKNFKRALGLALATACSIAGCYSAGDNDDVVGNGGGGSGGSAGAVSQAGKGGAAGNGGSVGSGGAAGSITTAGSSGTGGSAGGPGTADLGRACVTDAECGEGLICIARDDVTTLGGAPPGGLCTAPCASDDDCLLVSADGWCVPFGSGSYCLEDCAIDAGLNPKCHDRVDMVCSGVQFAPLVASCTESVDCGVNEVCLSGTCNLALTLCLPACGSDADCSAGLSCDYTTGLCQETPPAGKDFNEPCDPDGLVDECVGGYCSASYDVPTAGTCSGFCNLGHPYSCGYDGAGKADTACLFGTALGGVQAENGDLGLCGQLCDCDDECSSPGEVCRAFDDTAFEDLWQRLGYCVPIVAGGTFTADDAIGSCAGGAGGAGPGPAGGAGGAGPPEPVAGAGGASGGAGGAL